MSDGRGTKAIHHVGLTVRDLDVSAAFYHDLVGLRFVVPPTEWFEGAALARGLGVPPPVALRIALFEVGKGESWFEILQYKSPPSTATKAPPQSEIGAAHVAFHVADIQSEFERLQRLGVAFNSDVNVVDAGPLAGWRWVYFKDPDEHTIELVEVAYVDAARRASDLSTYLAARSG